MPPADEPHASVRLDPASVPARIVLAGIVGSFHSDELYFTCLSALERKTAVDVMCAEVEHLGGSAVQILLAFRQALAEQSLGFRLQAVPPRLATQLRDAGVGGPFDLGGAT